MKLHINDFAKNTNGNPFGVDAESSARALRQLADSIEAGDTIVEQASIESAAVQNDFARNHLTITFIVKGGRSMKFDYLVPAATAALVGKPGFLKSAVVGSSRVDGVDPKDLDIAVLLTEDSVPIDWYDNFDSAKLPELQDYDTAGPVKWATFRVGLVNYLVTNDSGWFDRMLVANEVIAALKLTDKGDRIVVNRIVRDGYNAQQAEARRNGDR